VSVSTNQLVELLAQKRGRKQNFAQGYAIVQDTETGIHTKVPLSEVREDIGHFEGKTGSMRRSRKGRSYRLANGRRFYCPGYGKRVIAYKVGR